jgi:hypothetical protein
MLACRANLAGLTALMGDTTSAETELRDVLAIQRRTFGEDHPSTLGTRLDLVGLLSRTDRATAASEADEVAAIASRTLGREHPIAREAQQLQHRLTQTPLSRRERRQQQRAAARRERRPR